MLFKTLSAAVFGIDAYAVDVEIDLTPRAGDSMMPVFTMVGLPDAAVRESRERIRAAINNCGFFFPIHRVTVNLAPADIKKEGSSFDLPIAVGILGANGDLKREELNDTLIVGELSLDGRVRPPRWPGRLLRASRAVWGTSSRRGPLDRTGQDRRVLRGLRGPRRRCADGRRPAPANGRRRGRHGPGAHARPLRGAPPPGAVRAREPGRNPAPAIL